MSLLRALGAAVRFIFAVLWSYCISLLATGVLLGAIFGVVAAAILSHFVSTQTGVLISAPFSWSEVNYLAGFINIMALLSLLPAFSVFQKNIIAGLHV